MSWLTAALALGGLAAVATATELQMRHQLKHGVGPANYLIGALSGFGLGAVMLALPISIHQ